VAACAALFALSVTAPPAATQKRKTVEPFAIIGGSVFREPGYALPEAKVVLALKDQPKGKKLETLTSPRGEFTFRVPPAPATYVVRVTCKGYHSEEKEASVTGEERVDVTFTLAPESK
jgi:hypothetical protein